MCKKDQTYYEKYKANRLYRQSVDVDFIDELGFMLRNHGANSDGSEGFGLLMERLGISWRLFHSWLEKFPQLREDYEQAKLLLGERRQANALLKKFDAGLAKFTLFHLLPEYKEIQKMLDDLKALNPEDARQKIVLIENLGEALEALNAVKNIEAHDE